MSARFADLMALSASQTRQSDLATQHLLAEKKRKEEQRKKEQQEKERKDREQAAKLVQKRLEEQQREEVRKQKAEEDRHQREMVLQRREEEHRKNLIYGKERRSGWASSGGGGGSGGGRTRKAKHGSDDDDNTTQVLTREEKRQRRLNSDLSRSFSSVRKVGLQSSSQSPRARPSKPVKVVDSRPSESRLIESHSLQHSALPPAGAVNSTMSIRQQLAAMPTTLMRLGTVKRDTRTIDEIMTDMHKAKEAKVIAGDEARGFNDWFQDRKKREPSIPTKAPSLDQSISPVSSGATTPYPSSSRTKEYAQGLKSTAPELSRVAPAAPQLAERKEPRTKVTIVKPEPKGSLSFSKTSKVTTSTSTKSGTSVSKPSILQPSRTASSASLPSKKRARSYSPSESDSDSPPARRRPGASSGRNDISSEIWRLFGKDRDRYMQNDVFSDDDDDMEADADALRREELRSMRIAKKEDEAALDEEKRHEEEKRRRRKEKERKGY